MAPHLSQGQLFIVATLLVCHVSGFGDLRKTADSHVSIWKSLESSRLSDIDPEAKMDFCQIVHYHGYTCEEYLHKVETEDGFLLTIHRITGKKGQLKPSKPRPPVFVQHGLLGDSTMWILNPPNETVPFMLSDAGYDVWLGNSRGNTYSRAHKTLKPSQSKFWAWSWDEMAKYDLPVSIDFVLNQTGYKQLHYVGHSQGTLIAFVHLSTTQSSKISHLIALGPVFNVSHMISPIRYLSPISTDIAFVLEIFGLREFLPSNWLMKWLADNVCVKDDPLHSLCSNILFLFCGFDPKELNATRVPVYINHAPAGTSVQDIVHFAQMYDTKTCSRFDYGSALSNLFHYGQLKPPMYDIRSVSTPVSLFSAGKDWLADPEDVQYIVKNLPNIKNQVVISEWDHLDFMWAVNAKTEMIDKIIDIIDGDFR